MRTCWILLACILRKGYAQDGCGPKCVPDSCASIAKEFEENKNWECALAHRITETAHFDDADAHYNLALAYERNNDMANAIKTWRAAAEIAPDDQDIANMLQTAALSASASASDSASSQTMKVGADGSMEQADDSLESAKRSQTPLSREIDALFAGWSWNGNTYDATLDTNGLNKVTWGREVEAIKNRKLSIPLSELLDLPTCEDCRRVGGAWCMSQDRCIPDSDGGRFWDEDGRQQNGCSSPEDHIGKSQMGYVLIDN